MGSFDDWLAAMPVEDVRERIAELERELQVMRLLERRHQERSGQGAGSVERRARRTPRGGRGNRLSPEREAILAVVAEYPDSVGPATVARVLHERGMETDTNAVGTNMSRMVRAGQLVRVSQGLYKLPPDNAEAPTLLNGSEGGDEG
jgi:hypothetical protein